VLGQPPAEAFDIGWFRHGGFLPARRPQRSGTT
jgi:hypothetical protein